MPPQAEREMIKLDSEMVERGQDYIVELSTAGLKLGEERFLIDPELSKITLFDRLAPLHLRSISLLDKSLGPLRLTKQLPSEWRQEGDSLVRR